MKLNRKRAATGAAIIVCLLAAGAISQPGRVALRKVYSIFGSEAVSSSIPLTPQGPDIGQRTRERQGWDTPPQSAVMRGLITYFDPTGAVARRGTLTVYRKYPEKIRVDIEHQGLIQAQGFDDEAAWQDRVESLTEEQQRDIRGWLRVWPERLFVARGRGSAYRETGRRVEDTRPEMPGRGPQDLRKAKELDQIEVEDEIGSNRRLDKRKITYLVDREEQLIYSVRWLEPDSASQIRADRGRGSSQEVRIDFGNWKRYGGVLWAMEITRWTGGQLDWQIEMEEVQVNRELSDTMFQKP